MRKILSFNISGTYFQYGVIREDGIILSKKIIEVTNVLTKTAIIELIKSHTKDVLKKEAIDGIAIGTAGQVNGSTGEVIYASPYIEDYTGTPLKQLLEQAFNLPVSVENNVNCAALAESWIGLAKARKSVFFISVGNGLGGSYVQNQQVQVGHTYSAGEIGYVVVDGKTLSDHITFVTAEDAKKSATQKVLEQLIKQYKAGQENAEQQINHLIKYLAEAVAVVSYVINPEVILLGGIVEPYKEVLLPLLKSVLQVELTPNLYEHTEFDMIDNIDNAQLIGAVKHFLIQEQMQSAKTLETIIDERWETLTKREKEISVYVKSHLEKIPQLTISVLAKKVKVSDPTITRYAKKLGLGSYNELRLLATASNVSNGSLSLEKKSIVGQVNNEFGQLMFAFEQLLDEGILRQFLLYLHNCKQLFLVGSEKQQDVLLNFATILREHGILTTVFTENENQLAQFVGETSLIIFFAITGYEDIIISKVKMVKDKKVPSISIANQKDAPIGALTNLHITLPQQKGNSQKFVQNYFVEIVDAIL